MQALLAGTEKAQIQPAGSALCRASHEDYQKQKEQITGIHDPLKIQYPGIIYEGQDQHDDKPATTPMICLV